MTDEKEITPREGAEVLKFGEGLIQAFKDSLNEEDRKKYEKAIKNEPK